MLANTDIVHDIRRPAVSRENANRGRSQVINSLSFAHGKNKTSHVFQLSSGVGNTCICISILPSVLVSSSSTFNIQYSLFTTEKKNKYLSDLTNVLPSWSQAQSLLLLLPNLHNFLFQFYMTLAEHPLLPSHF